MAISNLKSVDEVRAKPVGKAARITKTQDLGERLVALARALGPESRLPTTQQLCRDLDVSSVTLNRALVDLEARGTLECKRGVGIFVSRRVHRKTIGLVFDTGIFQRDLSPFWTMLLKEVGKRSEQATVRFYFASHDGNGPLLPPDLQHDLQMRRLDGMLIVGEKERIDPSDITFEIPRVAFASVNADWVVRIEMARFIEMGVRELKRAGCRDVALWIPHGLHFEGSANRDLLANIKTFRDELKKHGLRCRDEWLPTAAIYPTYPDEFPDYHTQGYYKALQVFGSASRPDGSASRPDGLVILNDVMTGGALTALQKTDVALGVNLQIATQTNRHSSVLLGYEDRLIQMEVDVAEVAQAMFHTLELLMNDQHPDPNSVFISPRLITAKTKKAAT